MRKNFICLILLTSLIFSSVARAEVSKEVLTTSVSKSTYMIGENVIVKINVYNSYSKAFNATWLFWFEPPIEENPATHFDSGFLAVGDYHEKTFEVKAERGLGQHNIIARLFDSSGKLLYENNETQFIVEGNNGTIPTPVSPNPIINMIIPLTIIAIFILIAIVHIFYRRKKMKSNQNYY